MSTPADTRRPEDSAFARLFEDDTNAWVRARPVRHRVVLAEIGLLGALLALTLWAASTRDGWLSVQFVVPWVLGTLLFIPLHSLLNYGIRGLFDRGVQTLDEHQRRLRYESIGRMHWLGEVLTLVSWTSGIAVASATGHTVLGLCVAFLLWMAAGLLPYWRLSWTMPDEDAAGA